MTARIRYYESFLKGNEYMPKYKPAGCLSSSGGADGQCVDICTNPVCGTPQYLTLLAPVVYDEIGVNLCRQVGLSQGFASVYPTAQSITAEVVSVDYSSTAGQAPTVTPINGRPNCYSVVLQDLTVNFAVKVYDCAGRLLVTLPIPAVYLPSSGTGGYAYYNEDTNPSSVELEIYAPYGVSYSGGNTTEPMIHYLGFSSDNFTPAQGLNMMIIPKVLSFDPSTGNASIGLSLYLKSIYYSQYRFSHNGRAVVPKGSLIPPEDSVCMDFVSGSLLDREIKPLELGPPLFEENLKNDCGKTPCCCPPPTPPATSGGSGTGTASSPSDSGTAPATSSLSGEAAPAPSADTESLLNTLANIGSL